MFLGTCIKQTQLNPNLQWEGVGQGRVNTQTPNQASGFKIWLEAWAKPIQRVSGRYIVRCGIGSQGRVINMRMPNRDGQGR